LPEAPDPIIADNIEIEIKEDGSKKSWAIKIDNQEEMRNYEGMTSDVAYQNMLKQRIGLLEKIS